MIQHPIEVILAKQLASHLAMPIFLVDPMDELGAREDQEVR